MTASPTRCLARQDDDRCQEERNREHEADEMCVVFPEAEDRGGHPDSRIVLRSAPWIARVDGPLAPVLTSAIPPGRDRSKIEKAPRNRGHTEPIPLGVAPQRKKQSKVAAQHSDEYEPGGTRAYEAGADPRRLAATPSSLTPPSSHGRGAPAPSCLVARQAKRGASSGSKRPACKVGRARSRCGTRLQHDS